MTVTEIRGGTRAVEASQERIAQYTADLEDKAAERADDLTSAMRKLQPDTTEKYPVPDERMFEIPDPTRQPDETPAYTAYVEAPDLARIAGRLIAQHDSFKHLRAAKATLVYAWKREGGKSGGKSILGRCTKLGGYAKFAADADFLIWLAADHLRDSRATERKVEACVFHELCHIEETDADEPTLTTIAHDFEGFEAELAVYGAWRHDLTQARRAFAQLPLDGV